MRMVPKTSSRVHDRLFCRLLLMPLINTSLALNLMIMKMVTVPRWS